MALPYRFLEHTTDAEIEAYGRTLSEAFENAGKGLVDTMVDIRGIRVVIREEIRIDGEDKESLLYSWLEALINKQDIEGMIYSNFTVKIWEKASRFLLKAVVGGEKFDPERHEQKTAIKSPTYHGMIISESDHRVTLRFLLDL